jgi:hypothetical protein
MNKLVRRLIRLISRCLSRPGQKPNVLAFVRRQTKSCVGGSCRARPARPARRGGMLESREHVAHGVVATKAKSSLLYSNEKSPEKVPFSTGKTLRVRSSVFLSSRSESSSWQVRTPAKADRRQVLRIVQCAGTYQKACRILYSPAHASLSFSIQHRDYFACPHVDTAVRDLPTRRNIRDVASYQETTFRQTRSIIDTKLISLTIEPTVIIYIESKDSIFVIFVRFTFLGHLLGFFMNSKVYHAKRMFVRKLNYTNRYYPYHCIYICREQAEKTI